MKLSGSLLAFKDGTCGYIPVTTRAMIFKTPRASAGDPAPASCRAKEKKIELKEKKRMGARQAVSSSFDAKLENFPNRSKLD